MKILLRNANGSASPVSTVLILLAASVFAGACSSGYHERRGAAAGAATGAIIGGIIGHQSGEEGEGAAIGAAAGAVIGSEMGEEKDKRERQEDIGYSQVDFGALMTDVEKQRIRERANKRVIRDWGYYLTTEEKQRLLERSQSSVGG